MAIKNFISTIILCIIMMAAGCETFTSSGKAGKAEQRGRATIAQIDDQKDANTSKKMESVSNFAFGLDYDLRKISNPPIEVEVALDLNTRILTLSGSPSLDRMKEMRVLVDKLTSDLEKEKAQGKKLLEEKDSEIVAIQGESKALIELKDSAVKHYMDTAASAAAQADGFKAQIDDLNSYWGLGAVFYGIKRFLVRFVWTFAIIAILFVILRFAAASNPIAASIFSVFEIGVSWVVQGIKTLFPKAMEFAGHTSTVTFNAYKNCMVKIIDSIQLVKDRASKSGKEATLQEAMDEVSKSMDLSEKKLVDDIKTQLNWH